MKDYSSYEEWEKIQGLSPSSPESYYAECAWNAAMRIAMVYFKKTRPVSDPDLTFEMEIEHMTGGLMGEEMRDE